VAKEKVTDAGYTHITHLSDEDLLLYNAQNGKLSVATVGRRPFSFNSPHNPRYDAGLLQFKKIYDVGTFSRNWSHIVSFSIAYDIVH